VENGDNPAHVQDGRGGTERERDRKRKTCTICTIIGGCSTYNSVEYGVSVAKIRLAIVYDGGL
jgi:hypothetical protein